MILVEYACTSCSSRSEHFVQHPIPATLACEWCTGEARRTWRTAGLTGTSAAPKAEPGGIDVSCRANPDIPALCHLTPAARRRLIAKARGDNRSLEREIEWQEKHVKDHGGAPAADVVNHDHSHGHSHGHAHGDGGSTATTPAPAAVSAAAPAATPVKAATS